MYTTAVVLRQERSGAAVRWLSWSALFCGAMALVERPVLRDDDDLSPPDSPHNLRDDEADGNEDEDHPEDDGEEQNGEPLPVATMAAARRRTETMRNDARHIFRRYQTCRSYEMYSLRRCRATSIYERTLRGRGTTQEEIATILNGLSADGQVAHLSIALCACLRVELRPDALLRRTSSVPTGQRFRERVLVVDADDAGFCEERRSFF